MSTPNAGPSPACPRCGDSATAPCETCEEARLAQTTAELENVRARIQVLDRERSSLEHHHDELLARYQRHHRRLHELRDAAALAPRPPSERETQAHETPTERPVSAGAHEAGRAPPRPTPSATRVAVRRLREISTRSVQNLLLTLGGLLLAISLTVFTVVSWGDLGLAARASVLGTLTALVGYCPRPLLRHDMRATAETLASLAALLLVLDAFAVWTMVGTEPNPGFTAGALVAVAAVLAGYPAVLTRGLAVAPSAPRVAALLLAQPVPLLAALSLSQPLDRELAITPALLLTCVGNALLLTTVRGGYPRALARHLSAATWTLGLIAGLRVLGLRTVLLDEPLLAWWPFAMLVLAGGAMLLDARNRVSRPGRESALAAATASWIVAAPATVDVLLGTTRWVPPVWALATLVAAVVLWLPTARTPGPTYTGAVSLGLVGWFGIPALGSLGDQLRWAFTPWEGRVAPAPVFDPDPTATVTLLATAAGAMALSAPAAVRSPERRGDLLGRPAIATGALAVVLGAQWLPHPGTVTVLVATTVALVATAIAVARGPAGRDAPEEPVPAWRARLGRTGMGAAGVVTVLAVSGALAAPATTIPTLATLLLAASTAAWVPRTPASLCRAVTVAAVLAATGLVVAGGLALSAGWGALMLSTLAVAGLTAALGGWLGVANHRSDQVRALGVAALAPMFTAWGVALPGGTHLFALALGLSALGLALGVGAIFLLLDAQGILYSPREITRWPDAADVGLARDRPTGRAKERVGRLLSAGALLAGTGTLVLVVDVFVRAVQVPLARFLSPWPVEVSTATPVLAVESTVPLALPAYGVAVFALLLLAAVARGRGAAGAVALAGGGIAVPLALASLAVPPTVVLTALVGTALTQLVVAGRHPGAPGRAALGTGVLLGVLATGWSLAAPGHTVVTLVALALGSALAAASASGPARRENPLVSGSLAFLTTIMVGATVLTGYVALPHAGVTTDPRWLPFLGLAVAGCASAACWLPWLANRLEQRTETGTAGIVLVVVSLATGIGAHQTLELVAAASALVLATLALVTNRYAATILALLTLVGAVVEALAPWARVMGGPYGWLVAPWSSHGRPWAATEVLSPFGSSEPVDPLLIPVLVFGAAVTLLLTWVWSATREVARARLGYATATLAVPVLGPVAAALDVNFGLALGWLLLVVASLLAAAAWNRSDRLATLCGGLALWPATMALAWALVTQATTLGTLLAVGMLAGTYPTLGRSVAVTAGSTVTATLTMGAFAVTLLLALGQPAEVAALALVAVIAGGAATVGAVRLPRPVTLAIECSLAGLSVVAVGLTLSAPDRLELTSVALATLGVTALASAPRRERGWLGPVGAGLLLGALWVLLGWLRITAPEPYLVVPALAALVLGWNWRHRHRMGTAGENRPVAPGLPRSWLAYGPGLALAMLPSLGVILLAEDGGPLRPASLVAASLAATLIGGWRRLQAPLFTGAAVLLVVGAHASGGYVTDLVLRMDRWIPVAVVGLLLLAVGARFERTLRDVRRLGHAIRTMD
ncbi:SCO7613 C-terminal domain-containing membrane protein [Halostreptopolyspora alba]|uniref:Uncharacterized protein n=1 Tax=Halostreptopolyspora alba TaxID=2487137 RepID=A0A3N0EI85_9ACTN|nr:hypothetical protein EFW17_01130 [Nocardiopsaceae bacterium YIM 96095]